MVLKLGFHTRKTVGRSYQESSSVLQERVVLSFDQETKAEYEPAEKMGIANHLAPLRS